MGRERELKRFASGDDADRRVISPPNRKSSLLTTY